LFCLTSNILSNSYLTFYLTPKNSWPEDAIEAIEQFGQYSSFRGNFDTQMTRDGASRLSPTQWWLSFGGDVGTLQKYALRIVSQCTSSSGCEQN
jgi:hypothetical protein